MKTSTHLSPLILSLLTLMVLPAGAQQKLLPAQSEIGFTFKQMGVPVDGRFKKFDAQINFDAAKLATSAVTFTVDIASATLGTPEIDAELPKAPWFNTAKFPQATFSSSAFKSLGAGKYEVSGKLSVKGQSQNVVVPLTMTQAGATTTAVGRGAQVAAAINLKTSQTGVTAVVSNTTGAVSLSAADGRNIIVAGTTGAAASVGLGAGGTSYGNLTAGTAITLAAATTSNAAGTIFINGVDVGAIAAGTSIADKGDKIAAAINAQTARTGVTATNTAGAISLTGGVYNNSLTDNTLTGSGAVTLTGLAAAGGAALTVLVPATGLQAVSRSIVTLSSSSATGINLATNDTGALAGGVANFTGLTTAFTAATTTAGAGVSALDLTSASGAQAALATVDSAITTVNSTRAALGAYQARFTSVVASLATTGENLTASRSRVQDADFAAETANLSRAQILQQAGTAMVAQANQLPQGVLALLR